MNLTLNEVANMCGGKLSNNSTLNLIIKNVVIDSRLVTGSSLFVAIKGQNEDASKYVKDVIKNNQNAALVNKSSSLDLPNIIYVDDTVTALGYLASQYRKFFNIPLVAITGSNGKTTVKEMLKNICVAEFGENKVLATVGNLNNHLGVPLTLLNLRSYHQVAIIEMGMNHALELDYLSKIVKPTIAVVNNVRLAHAGFFKNLKEIAKAKGEIYNGLSKNSGIACINMAEPFSHLWVEQVNKKQIKTSFYGVINSECYLKNKSDHSNKDLHKLNNYDHAIIVTNQGEIRIKLQILGRHNYENALTATILALHLNCKLDNIASGLEGYTGYRGRLERKEAFNGALIVDDSYNANPDSVKAAILAIKNLPKPHWFIFGDLKELGQFSQASHRHLGEFAAQHKIDMLLTIGDLAKDAYHTFGGKKLHFATNQDIVKYCIDHLPAGATLLVKGSHSTDLHHVVDKLLKPI